MVTYYLKLFYSRHAATLLYYIVVLFYLVICVSPFFMRTVMHIRFTKPLAFSLDEILTLRVSSTLNFHYVKELANCRGGGLEPPICITCHPIKVELYQLSYSPLFLSLHRVFPSILGSCYPTPQPLTSCHLEFPTYHFLISVTHHSTILVIVYPTHKQMPITTTSNISSQI